MLYMMLHDLYFLGIGMRSKEFFNKDAVQIAPFILLPSDYPRSEFQKAVEIQTVLGALMHKVAHDYDFLKESLKSTIKSDEFTKKLFDIYETVYKEGFTQDISVGLLRSDYMLHNDDEHPVIKQVELNTIATSFAGLATAVTDYHRHILMEMGLNSRIKNIPDNNAVSGMASGLVEAWKLYGQQSALMLFVVENVTYNICDQRFLEYEVHRQNPQISVVRKSLTELAAEARLGEKKELIVGDVTISVVYFRSGYDPSFYPTEKEWSARFLIERSRAIKCPSIQYHLAGCKRIQQVLSEDNILLKYLQDPDLVRRAKNVFAGLYSLDFNEEGEKAIAAALKNPEKFVLKPQREGGGNNLYDDELRVKLESMKLSEERCGWILMDRFYPPSFNNCLIRAGHSEEPKFEKCVTELGIYGVVIGNKDEIKVNNQVGHVLRTKSVTANEGGIVMGTGALDSPHLVD
ncbi:glutathione synthetase isoform X2 [Orussus abietinus]|uniref:glutathione synthetase isoform X2 n=1 Tax=Orussus abietinus TaxID=222816 RepID=UPI0006253029|nr:glutathione synthetase isoform X2 [Orussus abietinus]